VRGHTAVAVSKRKQVLESPEAASSPLKTKPVISFSFSPLCSITAAVI
jgi:hypothetical protein